MYNRVPQHNSITFYVMFYYSYAHKYIILLELILIKYIFF